MSASFIKQPALLEQLTQALESRDLNAVEDLAPRINWIRLYNLIHGPEAMSGSVIRSWDPTVQERRSAKSLRQWEEFARPALDVMVRNGFRVLDDPLLSESYTECVNVIPLVSQASIDYDLRGDENETAAHIALLGFPYLAGLAAALSCGVDVNAQTDRGDTALHYVWADTPLDRNMATEWAKSTQELLSRGANPLLENEDGVSARVLIEAGLAKPMMSRHREALQDQLAASVKAFSQSLPKLSARRR